MNRLPTPERTEKDHLFEAAFCGNAFQAQVAARATLQEGDTVAVMTLRGTGALVSTATVTKATPCYLMVNGIKYHRRNGKAVKVRKSSRVTVTLSALTPEVRAWMDYEGEENESVL